MTLTVKQSFYDTWLLRIQAQIQKHPHVFIADVFCLECLNVTGLAEMDSCQECGTRYTPSEKETCPACSSKHYDLHCQECDQPSLVDLDDLTGLLEHIEPHNYHNALTGIEQFVTATIQHTREEQ